MTAGSPVQGPEEGKPSAGLYSGPEPGKPGAGGAVPARDVRSVTPGRPGTPLPEHYDSGARSSLTDVADIMPRRRKARPGAEKPPQIVRRRASRQGRAVVDGAPRGAASSCRRSLRKRGCGARRRARNERLRLSALRSLRVAKAEGGSNGKSGAPGAVSTIRAIAHVRTHVGLARYAQFKSVGICAK
jgi:hypothetical protein